MQTPQWPEAGALCRGHERTLGPGCRVKGATTRSCCLGVFDAALLSLQGDRGFDGLAGLPGEKGHRVSICCGIWEGLFLPTGSGSLHGARFPHFTVSPCKVL